MLAKFAAKAAAAPVLRATFARTLATASQDSVASHFRMSKDETIDQFMPHPIYTKCVTRAQ